jgi:hypothetical protein
MTPALVRLSKDLATTVQFFSTHRVVEAHSWAFADRGRLIRAFAYVGEQGDTVLNIGNKTPGEPRLKPGDVPTEETVMQVAAKWSIDPTTFDSQPVQPALGWSGTLAPSLLR